MSTKRLINLTKSQLDEPNNRVELDTKNQNTELKRFGWNFQKIIFLEVEFFKTDELTGNVYM